MAQSFRLFQEQPTVTSSPIEIRVWIEDLDYSFLVYGENFERAEINGEKLLNITRQKLKELGVIRSDHQDIILKAVANINKKNKVEEQAMQEEDRNDKKMPTRFRKQSEHLEHAIDRVLVTVSERRRARTLHGTNEQPPHKILTAAHELINVVKMILNILERPPFDCMSEFSSLKNHLIKHITLLKHLSEQSDLNHEVESDIIDVCKNLVKMCHYIIALPPDLTRPETQSTEIITPEVTPPMVQVPIVVEPEAMSFSMEHGPDYVLPTQHLSMPITVISSSTEPVLPLQDMSFSNKTVPGRFECFCPESLNTPSNEGTIMMPHDEENKSEREVSDICSESLPGMLDYKILQNLQKTESDNPLMDSMSEKCVIDSDFDRSIVLDSELEQDLKDSDSVKGRMKSDFLKCLLETEQYQVALGSVKNLMESEQQLMGVLQCQVDFESGKQWTDSDSEQDLTDSDRSEMDSDNERASIESDSEECPMASASLKHLLKAEKCQMASDSVKRLMEFQKSLMETEHHWVISASEIYLVDSDVEGDKMGSASASGMHLMGKEKYQKEARSKRYTVNSDSEPCDMDSDSDRHELALAAAKCLMANKMFQLSTDTEGCKMDSWSERHTVHLDLESPGMASENERYQDEFESERHMIEMEREQHLIQFENEGLQIDEEQEKYAIQPDSEEEDRTVSHSERRHVDSEIEAHRLGARRKDNRPQGFWRPVFLSPPFDQGKKAEEKEKHCAKNW